MINKWEIIQHSVAHLAVSEYSDDREAKAFNVLFEGRTHCCGHLL